MMLHPMPSLLSGLAEYFPLQERGTVNRAGVCGTTLTNINSTPSAEGIVSGAAAFTAASSRRLEAASSAALVMGDIDFTITAWVYLTDKSTFRLIVSKDDGVGRDYALTYAPASDDRLRFQASDGTLKFVDDAGLGSVPLNTWLFVVAWHNNTAGTLNIRTNLGTTSTTSSIGTIVTSSTKFVIGALSNDALYWNGRICEVGLWKRLLTEQELRHLYNSGRGRSFPFAGRGLLPMRGGRGMRRDRMMGE